MCHFHEIAGIVQLGYHCNLNILPILKRRILQPLSLGGCWPGGPAANWGSNGAEVLPKDAVCRMLVGGAGVEDDVTTIVVVVTKTTVLSTGRL